MALSIKMSGIVTWVLMTVLTLAGYGQTNQADDIASSFIKYSREHFNEKIYAHTDKSFYVCGEIIWFKLYNVDAVLNQPSPVSKVAYVELLDKDQKPVLQAKVDLSDGEGNGSFFLPFSYTSGVYVLRAYTNWMKNFSPELFFEKTISVVNTLKRLPPGQKDSSAFSIRFFPESGNLVDGLETKIAFHAVDINGKGIKCQGVVYDGSNNAVASFASGRFGMGNFNLIPLRGEKYKAIINYESKGQDTVVLPAVFEKGYVMRLNSMADTNNMRVSVSSAGQSDNTVYLLVHTRQVLKLVQAKNLVDGQAEFLINKKLLGEGISHFTLFNGMRQPVGERLFFKRPQQELAINISIDQHEYKCRQKINTTLSTYRQIDRPVMASLSVAVYPADSLQALEQADIAAYFWLCSELRGKIESPGFYLNSNEKDIDVATDNLMLTHGWSRFKWENVLDNSRPVFRFLPEYEHMTITGKITDRFTGLPAANVLTYLSVPGKKFVFRSCTSDENGNIVFSVDQFYGGSDIIVQAHKKANQSYKIEINPPFSSAASTAKNLSFSLSKEREATLLSYSIASQVENTYAGEKRQEFFIPAMKDTTAFYGHPDKTYRLDDYTRFITMEEVMREYVAEVRVRKLGNDFSYRVKNDPYRLFFDNDPLVLLDGVPVFDTKKLMEYDPLKIKQIDVVARKYFTGKVGIEGIVSYATYKGDLDGYAIDPEAIVLEYPGLQLQREFYSPVYETIEQLESPLPDFRNTLFWAPNVNTGREGTAQVNFYTSDRPGRYAVFVQGITTDGLLGSKIIYFTVGK